MSEYKIVKTVELSGMPNPALAKDLLERLRLATAKVVENRKWRVPVLKEFYPQNRSLLGLNVNRGKSIMIRLREGHDQMTFLPWESVLGTLVHELTHNEIGEHSAAFYSMMEKVYDEVDATSSSGDSLWGPKIAPTPKYQFDGKSSKVGGGSLARKAGIAKDDVRQLAAEAALRRMGQQSSAGGQMVGAGVRAVPTKTRKELFLEAEERRRQLEAEGQPGCSLTTTNHPSAPMATNNDTIHPSSSRAGSSAGINSEWRWVCQVCTEENISRVPLPARSSNASSSASASSNKRAELVDALAVTCDWCGCMYGSSLLAGKPPGIASQGNHSEQRVKGALSNPSSNSSTKNGSSASNNLTMKNYASGSGSTVPEIFCIDCDSPQGNTFYGGKPTEVKVVDLVDDSNGNRSSGISITPFEGSRGRVVSAAGKEVCKWTRLEARGCPCCLVLLTDNDLKEADNNIDNTDHSLNAAATAALDGAGEDERKTEADGGAGHSSARVTVKKEDKTSNSSVCGERIENDSNGTDRSRARTAQWKDEMPSATGKRKKDEMNMADVIVID